MLERQARRTAKFLSSWIVVLALVVGCDSNFDTAWEKPETGSDASEGDAAAGDAGDAGAVEMDAAQDASGLDAGDTDGGVVPILPLQINCAGFARDAGADGGSLAGDAGGSTDAWDSGCDIDCSAACLLLCRDAGGCADADVWLSCSRCLLEGGLPPPTL